MFSHQSGRMFQRSQVSWVALYTYANIKRSLTLVSDKGHLLSWSGQQTMSNRHCLFPHTNNKNHEIFVLPIGLWLQGILQKKKKSWRRPIDFSFKYLKETPSYSYFWPSNSQYTASQKCKIYWSLACGLKNQRNKLRSFTVGDCMIKQGFCTADTVPACLV